jgi:hypothetical protein
LTFKFNESTVIQPFKMALQREIIKNKSKLMDAEEMYIIGCNVGVLSKESKASRQDARYTFMHKTVAEFAVAKLLYNTKLWKVTDSLHEDKWSMIHYYLLMHSIHTDSNDDDLWKHQLKYTFKRRSWENKGNIIFTQRITVRV